jgi:hypothetical protein
MAIAASAGVGLRVRAATLEDTEPVVALLNATFRTPIDADTWLWYTRANPVGPSRVYVANEAATDDIVGVIAFAPMEFRLHGALVRGDYAHHLAYRPAYRDTLSYLALCGYAFASQEQCGVQLVIGPPNKRAYPIHKVLGHWRDFGYLDILRKLPPFAQGHDCEPLDRFDDDFDDFYGRISSDLQFRVEKNAAWANWRFRDRPGDPYTVYAAREGGKLAGYIVLKRWHEPGYSKAHILDLHAANEAALGRIIAAAEDYAAGCNELNLWAVRGYPYRPQLEANGFAVSHRQPLLARMLNGFAAEYPDGPCSLMYGDGDTQY